MCGKVAAVTWHCDNSEQRCKTQKKEKRTYLGALGRSPARVLMTVVVAVGLYQLRDLKSKGWTVYQDGADWWKGDEP
jgi:hypothetical protein